MKTEIKTHAFLCLLLGVYCMSCTLNSSTLPLAQGNAGELLIVMNDDLWKGTCGDSVRHYFTEPVWGLPAPEPMFTLSQKANLSQLMQKFRNIIIINIEQGLEHTKLGVKADVYARNQLVFNMDAPSPDSIITCMAKNRDLIATRFMMKDRDNTIEDYQKQKAQPIIERMREKYQVDILIPKPYKLDVEKENFVWIAREEGERNWGILMWKDQYVDKNQLVPDSLIARMNAVTRKNIASTSAGSYMADEPSIPPAVRIFEKNGVYSVQLNGLWQMENGWMGGPYVCQTIVDAERGQLVTAMGFVFYPNRDKRQMIRQLEAILYTMMPVAETSVNEAAL